MRWFTRGHHRAPLVVEPIERVDPTSLEVIALDGDGHLHRPLEERSAPGPREIGYAPRDGDPTSLAGVWEALART